MLRSARLPQPWIGGPQPSRVIPRERGHGAPGMPGPKWQRGFLVALIPLAAACGSTLKSQAPVVKPAQSVARVPATVEPLPAAQVVQAPVEDPVLTLIAASETHFKAGQKELEQGHVEAAKQEFNR